VPGIFEAFDYKPASQTGPSLVAPNRLVLAPMTTYSSLEDGNISPDELPYLHRRAKGGIGLIMTAACYVHESGHAFRGQWACSDDRFLPSLKSVADAIREGGAKSVLQIHHGGRQCPPDLCGGEPISASAVAAERPNAVVPREMTDEEIRRTIDDYAQAARRAKEAGFDGVEIHGANTYLIQQFVSPHSNRRTDYWNAADLRFPIELVEAVLAAVGPDYPVGYRFSPEENETPGIRLEHTERLIKALIEYPLSWLHISLAKFDQPSLHDASSEPVGKTVLGWIGGKIPLIGVGSVKSAADAERAIEFGYDAIAIGRTAISEPEWGLKARSGEPIRTKIPAGDFAESLTVSRGLVEKINAVEGWFERD